MKIFKRALVLLMSLSMIFAPIFTVNAKDVEKVSKARQVEYLGRGGYGICTENGVYLSWRLLGTEPINQTFDVYRGDTKIQEDIDATNYIDPDGRDGDSYKVVPHNGIGLENDEFTALANDYFDIMLNKPETNADDDYTYEFNDTAIGDVDNDGQYEFIIKWDPTNKQDNSNKGYTGNVLIDCYKQNGTRLWRIDLGPNIRAGSHYTQIIVYDFDGDGKAEMALRTAPGSKDGENNYVSTAGAPIEIDGVSYPLTWEDEYTHESFTDESDMRDQIGGATGKILHGPDWLTMFNGETGKAMATVNYYPQRGNVNDWGDNYANRSERYNAGVAYLDGEHPSYFTSRGYYMRAAMAAYDWDGEKFTMLWHRNDKGGSGSSKIDGTLYGNGNHQISVCDADNDGKDEIVFGSTVVDDDGSILNSTNHGHGDALHVSDFNNDGKQEIFQIHEDAIGFKNYGAEVRRADFEMPYSDIKAIIGAIGASRDVGRGLIGNFDDNINDESEFFSATDDRVYTMSATDIGPSPGSINPSFLVWWDGDLDREILSRTTLLKYDISKNDKNSGKSTVRTFEQVHTGDKDAPALSADLLGDWREEICYPTEDNTTLRVFMTTIPTDYKIPTLMHDTQYHEAIAWQNVGYNQPPHPKFYVGKAALADNKKYLNPKTGFDIVKTTNQPILKKTEVVPNPDTKFTVTVSAMGDINKTFNIYENVPYGDSLTYTYPKFIVENGIAYEAKAGSTSSSTHYGGSITHVTKDQNVKINYIQSYGGVVDFKDFNNDTGRNAVSRASDGMGLTTDSKIETEYKLKPGNKYKVFLRYYNRGSNSEFVADGQTLCKIESNNGTWAETIISDVTVENESPVSVTPANGQDSFDIIMIINETISVKEETNINLLSEETELVTVNDTSKTSSNVVLPGTLGDIGTKQPNGYITYTPSKDGTLSFTFKSSVTKDSKNRPRVYYCIDDFAIATKNNSDMIAEASGANSDTTAELEVKAGTTYYIFGYLYNYTNDFEYTFSDFKFTDREIKKYPVKYVNYDGSVLQEENLSIGLISEYRGEPPKKPDDYKYKDYKFIGWDKEVKEITGATTYTAQFVGMPQTHDEEAKTSFELLPKFNSWMHIERIAYDGNIVLIASKKDERPFANTDNFSVYIVQYGNDDTLETISKVDFTDNGDNTLSAVFRTQSSNNCKIFLWTDKQEPVIDVITDDTTE
ncbi:MAG: rhamnogalacturonan lyase [Clostridia bacterium]